MDNDEPTTAAAAVAEMPGEAKSLTIYSSRAAAGRFPRLHGGSRQRRQARPSSRPATRPAPHTIKYVPLDDSTAQAGNWTPEATSANALEGRAGRVDRHLHRRVQLGRFEGLDPDPLRGGRPADLPGEHVRGPDDRRPGLRAGEPDKYYPTGDRTYTRIVPKDTIQAAALVTLMKGDGCTKVAHDQR